jgi:cyanophycinase
VNRDPKGTLIIIGGREDRSGERAILKRVAESAAGSKPLVIVTVATTIPEQVAAEYQSVFKDLGVPHIEVLDIRTREQARDAKSILKMEQAAVVFFTGGDQLRLTSQLGDSPVFQELKAFYERGGTIAGTSAGAAAMPATMIVGGPSDKSNRISALNMAPGLGFIADVIIDSHFAERGRMGRLLGAVAQNPRYLGLGIDEDTAIVVERGKTFRVLGSGGVYIVDGSSISFSSLSERQPEGTLSILDVTLHVLAAGDRFDLAARRPILQEGRERLEAPRDDH